MARPVLAFTIAGSPVAQGSKVVGRTKAGGTFVRESNQHALDAWRRTVADRALHTLGGGSRGSNGPLPLFASGPCALHLTFVLPRPKAHYGSGRNARQVKPSAPWYVATKPDLDKLLRAVGDALTGIAWRDDSQVASVQMGKVYGPRAQVHVEVVGLPHGAAAPE